MGDWTRRQRCRRVFFGRRSGPGRADRSAELSAALDATPARWHNRARAGFACAGRWMPITHYGKSIQVTATTTSAAYALPDGHPRYEVINRGPNNVYVAFGASGVTAAAPSETPSTVQLVPAGAVLAGDLVGGVTHMAVISDAATARVVVQMGA